MKRILITCIGLCLYSAGLMAQNIGAEWPTAKPEVYGYSSKSLQNLNDFISENLPTTGMVVVVDGKLIHQFGNITELSYLASCRKSVLSMLYGIYTDRGKIDLSKTLADMGIDDHQKLSDLEKSATIDNIINSSSGIYHPASNPGDNLANAPKRGSQRPGSYFLYSNWDFNAAGGIFERETGVDIFDALESELAVPLGMQDFKRSAQKKTGNLSRSVFPAYHMWLSTRDMARLGQLMLQKGKWNGKQLISEAWVAKSTTVVTPVEKMNPDFLRNKSLGYAYMWWIWDREDGNLGDFEGAYSARGAYGQYITVIPKLKMVVAHKTKPRSGNTDWDSFWDILNKIVEAKN